MTLWDQIVASLPGIIAGALTIALGALIIWVARLLWMRVRGQVPDFTLERRGEVWELKRVRRRPALEVHWAAGSYSGSLDLAPLQLIRREMRQDDRIQDSYPDQVWFVWIDRGWRFSRSITLREGVDLYEVFASKPSLDGMIRT